MDRLILSSFHRWRDQGPRGEVSWPRSHSQGRVGFRATTIGLQGPLSSNWVIFTFCFEFFCTAGNWSNERTYLSVCLSPSLSSYIPLLLNKAFKKRPSGHPCHHISSPSPGTHVPQGLALEPQVWRIMRAVFKKSTVCIKAGQGKCSR